MPEPFPLSPPAIPGFAASPSLQKLLEDGLKASKRAAAYKHMSVALVDLTRAGSAGKPGQIDYAGVNDDKEQRIFSLAKIGTMFAAFRLRERVRVAGAALAGTPADVFTQLEAAWKTKVVTRVPEL